MIGKIAEVFNSVQGEGVYVGERQLFVRFFGCNMNCRFCDTKLDYFREYESPELFNEITMLGNRCHSVSFTGGEPLLQKDFLQGILKLTKANGIKNYLETNGTLPDELEEVIEYLDIVAMDVKLPSSTGEKSFWQEHRRFLKIASSKEVFLKAIICKSTQENDLQEVAQLIKEINKSAVLVLQPNSFEINEKLMAKARNFQRLCLNRLSDVRIIPQMHKIAGLK